MLHCSCCEHDLAQIFVDTFDAALYFLSNYSSAEQSLLSVLAGGSLLLASD